MRHTAQDLLLVVGCLLPACTGSNPDFDPSVGNKRIFVTQGQYLGGDPSYSQHPGLQICERSAAAGGLGGHWLPWLSYHISGPVNAIDEIADVGPWHDLKGALIFANKAELTRGPLAPLVVTEFQTELNAGDPVWTGTYPTGTRSDGTCFDLTQFRVWYSYSADHRGDIGIVGDLTEKWTYAGSAPCNQRAHLICIEQ